MLAMVVSVTAGASAWAMSSDMESAAGMAGMVEVAAPACDDADCPDPNMTGMDCYAMCSGTLGVLTTSPLRAFPFDQDRRPVAVRGQAGQISPPDPSPPRFSVQS
ncbi:MAG: hypothetical protein WD645_00850 [Dehalococcoidia bacterium]